MERPQRSFGLLGLIGELMSWRHDNVPVDSRKMGWLGVATQEMRIEKVDRPTTPRVWAVTVCPADPLCILVQGPRVLYPHRHPCLQTSFLV